MTVAHISTVHPRTDTRIFVKEVATIRDKVTKDCILIVQDGLPDEEVNGTRITSAGPKLSRQRYRILVGVWRMLFKVLSEKPKIVHFHDPELIPIGLIMKLIGKKVVYDVHEDVPAQLLGGQMNHSAAKFVGAVYRGFEWLAKLSFSKIVVATPAIGRNISDAVVLVQNFPLLNELSFARPTSHKSRPPAFAYIGGITAIRSALEMVEAIGRLSDENVRLQMGGSITPASLEARVKAMDGWSRVDFHGWVGREKARDILANVRAGLVLFHPVPNHVRAQPNKLFEYMAAGLPLIASDFPLWREIVDGAGCGLLVNPEDPVAIAEAMQWILDNPDEAEAMGRRGRAAVEERFNWEAESEKLVALYRQLLHET